MTFEFWILNFESWIVAFQQHYCRAIYYWRFRIYNLLKIMAIKTAGIRSVKTSELKIENQSTIALPKGTEENIRKIFARSPLFCSAISPSVPYTGAAVWKVLRGGCLPSAFRSNPSNFSARIAGFAVRDFPFSPNVATLNNNAVRRGKKSVRRDYF